MEVIYYFQFKMFILIFIIAISSSIMDTLKDKFSVSIFRNLNPYFWNPVESWKNKYKNRDKSQGRKYPEYLSGVTDSFSDAWHIFKLIIVVSIIVGFSIEKDFNIYNTLLYWIEYGLVFKLTYKLFSK